MKKKVLALALACAVSLSLLAGCGNGDSGNSSSPAGSDAGAENSAAAESVTIRVGATPAPHVQILEQVVDVLAEQGITLEIVEINDYNTPNDGVEDGSLDANYFQHITYMNEYNESHSTHLVSVGEIHYEPLGLYAGKTASVEDLPDGAQIAVPNDATNEARALLLLEQEGLITLAENAGINATVLDIVDNPKNLEIVELEAAQIPSRLADVDLAVINGNYAMGAGMLVSDALAIESSEGEAATAYANVVAVKEGNENNEAILALVDALKSDEVKAYMEETFQGSVVPLF
ncbi:MAG TPA: metal ABC transporter substrate-binding protein [Candidatus Enterenecus stercoripullorum]|nr:metal ABC transporter substrate-binding protein [Candidatus Enterenecus stercoripullorum]